MLSIVTGYKTRSALAACLIVSLGLLIACSALRGLLGQDAIRRPQVEFVGARLTGLSFDRATIVFEVNIQNPNSLGVKLAGFGYDLIINDHSFLHGREEKEVEIEARGENVIDIPVTISYQHLYQVLQTLRHQNSAAYRLNCDFSLVLPVLGVVQIPVSKTGDFPLPKLPTVSLEKLQMKRLSLSGADLVFGVRVDNPNAFAMTLEGMQYQLMVDGQPWASGETGQRISLPQKRDDLLEIPITLDFIRMGQAVYQSLSEGRRLDYQFRGDLDLTASLPLLGRTHVPFDHFGQVAVLK